MESQFAEVKITHFDDIKNRWMVDAWRTSDPNEEGRVLCEIDPVTKKPHWREDTNAHERTDPKVMAVMIEFMQSL